jgi:aspartate aminotransferase-like enzyme
VVSIGNFGERWVKISEAYGLNVTKLEYEWGTKADPADIEKALAADPEIKGVLVTHSETSTGVVNDIETMGAIVAKTPAIIIVDAISGLGASDLKTDAWKLDIVVAGSQKALMTPPGLAFAAISDKAWALVEKSTLPKFYFDYKKSRDALHKAEPQSPFTPAVSTIMGLAAALRMIREEGLDKVFARHAVNSKATREGVKALGLRLFGEEDPNAHSVTAVRAPEGIDGKAIVKKLRVDFGITAAGGQGKVANTIFRIGHCGYYDKFDILSVMSGLEMALKELGLEVKPGAGVAAAEAVFQAAE